MGGGNGGGGGGDFWISLEGKIPPYSKDDLYICSHSSSMNQCLIA